MISIIHRKCLRYAGVSLITFILLGCNPGTDATYNRIRAHCDQIRIINTHEHQHWPEEFGDHTYGFFHLLRASYLMADVVSAGGRWLDFGDFDTLEHDRSWEQVGEALDYTRGTSYYSQFIRGFQTLYDFSDPYFTKENTARLSEQISGNYENYRDWFDEAFRKAGFELMFNDQYWNAFNTDIDAEHFALVFHINPLVMQSGSRPAAGGEPYGIYAMAAGEGRPMESLEDYLYYCELLFQRNVEQHAVCVKNSMAYARSLYYENVPFETASELYAKDPDTLLPEERKMIQDFLFHWIIRKCITYNLPIQIHTGYLAGNGNTLDKGQPKKLNNLFLLYPEARFVLFHGGYPWTGEYAAFGKMFPNVYLDLVWLPQISREEAVHALEEILDGTPYNKLFWGGDSHFIEESAGALGYGKDVVATVLANRVKRGLMTEELALEITERIFRENAIEVFRLEERLGRSF